MKLPRWIPQVSRPWNPAFRETWDAMTTVERQMSFLFDCAIVGLVVAFLMLTGCQKTSEATGGTPLLVVTTKHTSPAAGGIVGRTGAADGDEMSVVSDPITGCEYLRYKRTYEASLTARMYYNNLGQYRHMGCK